MQNPIRLWSDFHLIGSTPVHFEAEAMAEVFVNPETGQSSNKRKVKKQDGESTRKKPNLKLDLSKIKKGMVQTTLD